MHLILKLERERVTERKAIELCKRNVTYHIGGIIIQKPVSLALYCLSFLNKQCYYTRFNQFIFY